MKNKPLHAVWSYSRRSLASMCRIGSLSERTILPLSLLNYILSEVNGGGKGEKKRCLILQQPCAHLCVQVLNCVEQ